MSDRRRRHRQLAQNESKYTYKIIINDDVNYNADITLRKWANKYKQSPARSQTDEWEPFFSVVP